MLKLVLSNSQLNGVCVEYQMKSPFHLMAKWASNPIGLREWIHGVRGVRGKSGQIAENKR